MSLLVDHAWTVAAVPALMATGYLFLLTLFSRRRSDPWRARPRLRFDVVVPAHDEEAGVASTVQSVLRTSYPPELVRVLVVADNCSDDTAARARAAGATVIEREDRDRRGKGYALAVGFERCLADGLADAIVVVDADTVVSRNLLTALSARLESGAKAAQVRYGVRNPDASWRTRLMALALCLFHRVRSLGRERLGVSAGLRGNGMCLSASLLREVPYRSYSLVEDVEYGIQIGVAGHRVRYVDEALVLGEMVGSEGGSRSQRRRWEGGRRAMCRAHGLDLLRAAIRRQDGMLLDLALDLLVPPLSIVSLAVAVGLVGAILSALAAGRATASLHAWGLCGVFLLVHVGRGIWLSGLGLRAALILLTAPAYVTWKLLLPLLPAAEHPLRWQRTAREPPGSYEAHSGGKRPWTSP